MDIHINDIQTVPENEGTLFSMLNQGTTDALIFLSNVGSTNTLNYRFQQCVNTVWQDISANPDGIFYATLIAGQTRSIQLTLANPQVRLVGNASGGTSLWFSISRWTVRSSGGALPILSY